MAFLFTPSFNFIAAMGSSFQVLAFLLFASFLSISTAIQPHCGSCNKPPLTEPVPPVTLPKVPVVGVVPLPPVTVPKLPVVGVVPLPPVTVPKVPVVGVVPLPPVTVPKVPAVGVVPLPPFTVPKVPVVGVVPLPPVSIPKLPLPPTVITTPTKGKKPCAPPAHKKATCPSNTVKLGACASVLGRTISISVGDPAVGKCCPILSGFVDAEAAACLCATLKMKALNLKIYVPVALQLLVTCGKTPPPGFTCAI